MDNGRELIEALIQVSHEKGIDKEVIFEAIEASLVSACKKHFGSTANVRVVVDRETGEYIVLAVKTVVENVTDDIAEISLADARKINSKYELEDTVEIKLKPGKFGRISAQTAKQVVVQKFREAERENLYNEYIGKLNHVITGIVQRADRRNIIINIGNMEAFIPIQEQIQRENYDFNRRLRVFVLEVKQTSKGPIVNVSRTHPELLKSLFEQEVPEVGDGTVEIKSVVRDAGNRSKVAVYTKHPHVDPIGSCVGQHGQRVNAISSELNNEKIDIVNWSSDPKAYIAAALSPSKVTQVAVDEATHMAHVVVPDNQLSLAIGKEGLNARLAARLTGWKIEIQSESQAKDTDFLVFSGSEVTVEAEKTAELETAYANFYEEPAAEVVATEMQAEVADDEYYDDEYYDDEYYDDEYYDDEYYDDEYYEAEEPGATNSDA